MKYAVKIIDDYKTDMISYFGTISPYGALFTAFDKTWVEMSNSEQENWGLLGRNADNWDKTHLKRHLILTDDYSRLKFFSELSSTQQIAATALGYNEKIWNYPIYSMGLVPESIDSYFNSFTPRAKTYNKGYIGLESLSYNSQHIFYGNGIKNTFNGEILTYVYKNSLAWNAGLRAQDVVLRVKRTDEDWVSVGITEDAVSLETFIALTTPKTAITIEYQRSIRSTDAGANTQMCGASNMSADHILAVLKNKVFEDNKYKIRTWLVEIHGEYNTSPSELTVIHKELGVVLENDDEGSIITVAGAIYKSSKLLDLVKKFKIAAYAFIDGGGFTDSDDEEIDVSYSDLWTTLLYIFHYAIILPPSLFILDNTTPNTIWTTTWAQYISVPLISRYDSGDPIEVSITVGDYPEQDNVLKIPNPLSLLGDVPDTVLTGRGGGSGGGC